MTADRFCQSFPWSFENLPVFQEPGAAGRILLVPQRCCWKSTGVLESGFVALLFRSWPIFHPLGMGSFSGKPLMLSATTQPMVTGLFSWGDMPQLAIGNPGRRTAYRTLLVFDWPWRWGTWSSQESGPCREHTWKCHFFPKVWWWFLDMFQRFLPTFRSGNLAGFFSTNHGVVQNNSSKQVGFWHSSRLDSSLNCPGPWWMHCWPWIPRWEPIGTNIWLGIYPKDEGGIFDPAIRRSWEFCIFAAETRNLHRSSSPTSGTRDGQWLGHSSRTNPQRPGLVEVVVA